MPDFKLGLALGSGSARGWSHIGVIQALNEVGLKPDIVVGSSVGALVGASYAAGTLPEFTDWVTSLTTVDIVRFFDLTLSGGGLILGKRVMGTFSEQIAKRNIEDLSPRFAAVATELYTGREIWLTRGPLLEAVRASIALPGLFTPIQINNRWLVDGGLVNPVPVSVCRALGADIVIAVNLNGDIISPITALPHSLQREKHAQLMASKKAANANSLTDNTAEKASGWSILDAIKRWSLGDLLSISSEQEETRPRLLDVTLSAINIMQDRITRSRLAGDPADVVISPRLSDVRLMEFHRATECIEEGRRATLRMTSALEELTYIKQRDGL